MKVSRWVMLACAGILAVGLAAGGALINTDSGSAAAKATFKAALVSDIGSFSDKSFNESQLDGLKRAKANLGVDTVPLESKSASQYAPNFNKAVRGKSDLVIAAGFLLANTVATYAKKFPDTKFAITDYGAEVPPLGSKTFKPLYPNVEGLTYAANEGGCLVGVLAAKMAPEGRQEGHRRGRRHQDPAGRHLDRGLPLLREEGGAGHEGPDQLLAGLQRDPTSARRSGREPDRPRREGALPGRRRSAARAPSRRPTRPASGASASTRTSTTTRSAC